MSQVFRVGAVEKTGWNKVDRGGWNRFVLGERGCQARAGADR